MVGKVQRSFTGSDYGFFIFVFNLEKKYELLKNSKKKK